MIRWLGQASCGDDGTGWDRAWQRLECEVLELANQRRAAGATCGGERMPPVGPLSRHSQLTDAARRHARDMGDRGYLDHFTPEGRSPFDLMKAAGFTGTSMAENISGGKPTAREVVDGWMQSPSHCRNIMSGAYTKLGVGYYRAMSGRYPHVWVQNFGGGVEARPPAPPRPSLPSRRLPRPIAVHRSTITRPPVSVPADQDVTSVPPSAPASSSVAPLLVGATIIGGAALLLLS